MFTNQNSVSIRIIVLTLLFVWPISLMAQFSNGKIKDDIQKIENITKLNESVLDSAQLKENLIAQLAKAKLSSSLVELIVYDILLAKKIASNLDAKNNTSDILFVEALNTAKKTNRADLQLWASSQYGFYLYRYRELQKSFPYFMSSIDQLDQSNEVNVIQLFETYQRTAYFLLTVGDLQKAEVYLLKAKKWSKPNSKELGSITDALGLLYSQKNNFNKAILYFNETLLIAKECKDTLRYAKALGNIGELKWKQKKYPEAIALLLEDIKRSKQVNNVQNTIYAQILLGKIYVDKGLIADASNQLNEAEKLAKSKPYLKSSDFEINSLVLTISKITGDATTELKARRTLEHLKKNLEELDGADVINKMIWEREKINLSFKLEAQKARNERDSYLNIAAIAVCLMLIGILIVLRRNYRNTIRSKKNEFERKILKLTVDKLHSEQKLTTNQQTLKSYKTYLLEKNTQIESLEQEMQNIKDSSNRYLSNYSERMQQLLDSHLISNEAWLDFKSAFIQNYSSFYQFLMQNYPGLTDSHLRIIFLSKLDMNNTEIARVLGLTVDAVKKAKQRLRKKYGVEYDLLFKADAVSI